MKQLFLVIGTFFIFHEGISQARDSLNWMRLQTDSGIVHAAVAIPKGPGPFPAIMILHGTHGFAEEYVQLARRMAKNGIVGIAACWFAGRKGEGTRFITPIDCKDAPPLVDVAGPDRFRIARIVIDSLIQKVSSLPYVKKDQLTLFGHSRGAGATLDYAITQSDKVQALILNSCGYPEEVIKRAIDITIPVMIFHGTADGPADGGSTFTNIEMARKFEAALRTVNKRVDTKYYEGSGHNAVFSDPKQFDDMVERMISFQRNIFVK